MTAIEAAELAGIDLSLIEENLRLTPEQRVIQHDSALELVLAMEAAGQKLRDATHSASSATMRG
jgi:hypothetical protein